MDGQGPILRVRIGSGKEMESSGVRKFWQETTRCRTAHSESGSLL